MKITVTAALEGDLARDFEALVRATKVNKAALVRQALELFIKHVLEQNDGIAADFKTWRDAERHKHLAVIK